MRSRRGSGPERARWKGRRGEGADKRPMRPLLMGEHSRRRMSASALCRWSQGPRSDGLRCGAQRRTENRGDCSSRPCTVHLPAWRTSTSGERALRPYLCAILNEPSSPSPTRPATPARRSSISSLRNSPRVSSGALRPQDGTPALGIRTRRSRRRVPSPCTTRVTSVSQAILACRSRRWTRRIGSRM